MEGIAERALDMTVNETPALWILRSREERQAINVICK